MNRYDEGWDWRVDGKGLIEEIRCRQCDGYGNAEVGPNCSVPASECCGGCYEEMNCEICWGSGWLFVDVENDEGLMDNAMMMKSIEYRIAKYREIERVYRKTDNQDLEEVRIAIINLDELLDKISDSIYDWVYAGRLAEIELDI